MAIVAYTGLPGSGKSYEVVKSVIVPALKRGQRVVTNIRGVRDPDCVEVTAKHLGVPPGRVLQLIKTFEKEDMYREDFFPTSGNDDGVLEWGAVNIIDEAWWVFGKGTKFDQRAQLFLRMHRHEEDGDGRSTLIVVLTQAVDDLTRFVADVVEETTRTVKKLVMGTDKAYWLRKYPGNSEVPSKLVAEFSYKYEAPFKYMYKTGRNGASDETRIDRRGSIFANQKLIISAALVAASLAFFALAGPYVWKALTGQDSKAKAPTVAAVGGDAKAPGASSCSEKVVLVERSAGVVRYFVMREGSLYPVGLNSVSGSPPFLVSVERCQLAQQSSRSTASPAINSSASTSSPASAAPTPSAPIFIPTRPPSAGGSTSPTGMMIPT